MVIKHGLLSPPIQIQPPPGISNSYPVAPSGGRELIPGNIM